MHSVRHRFANLISACSSRPWHLALILFPTVLLLTACPGPSTNAAGNRPDAADSNRPTADSNARVPDTGPADANQTAQIPPAAQGEAIRLIGRFDVTNPNNPTMGWPGSQIVIGFTGTRLSVTLSVPRQGFYAGSPNNSFVSVSVDGGALTSYEIKTGTQTYTFANALTSGQHTVVISKRTEAQIGLIQFIGAQTDGNLTFTPAPLGRRIQVVGDSGPAGYGTDGMNPCGFTSKTENADLAFPAVAGRLLNAEVHNLSYSGKGIVQNRDMQNDAYKTLAVLWERTLPNDEDPQGAWDHKKYVPQAVFVITGGNDAYAYIPDETTYRTKAAAFLKRIRAVYPGVHVWLSVSPMLHDDAHPNERNIMLRYAKGAVTDAQDTNIHYIELPSDEGVDGYGCDQHMSPGTHRKVAQAMADAIRAQLTW